MSAGRGGSGPWTAVRPWLIWRRKPAVLEGLLRATKRICSAQDFLAATALVAELAACRERRGRADDGYADQVDRGLGRHQQDNLAAPGGGVLLGALHRRPRGAWAAGARPRHRPDASGATEAHLRAQDHLMIVANMRGESPQATASRMLGERVLVGCRDPRSLRCFCRRRQPELRCADRRAARCPD